MAPNQHMTANIQVRKAMAKDLEALFSLSNHPSVRQASFKSRPISWGEHEKWFSKTGSDPQCGFYVAEIGEKLAGQLRFSQKHSQTSVSISVNPEVRAMGVGSALFRLALQDYCLRHPVDKIIARIRKNNSISFAFFKKLGFEVAATELVGKVEAYVLVNYLKR